MFPFGFRTKLNDARHSWRSRPSRITCASNRWAVKLYWLCQVIDQNGVGEKLLLKPRETRSGWRVAAGTSGRSRAREKLKLEAKAVWPVRWTWSELPKLPGRGFPGASATYEAGGGSSWWGAAALSDPRPKSRP